jgi:hypothetical protein
VKVDVFLPPVSVRNVKRVEALASRTEDSRWLVALLRDKRRDISQAVVDSLNNVCLLKLLVIGTTHCDDVRPVL